jgi:serine/threonine protein kinase
MLTGRYAFDTENVLDLVHLHILQEPEPVCSVNPDIPILISRFVSKLMAKHVQDRYHSGQGIIHDLDLMISEIDTDSTLNSVKLGQYDLLETFYIPQKLYGRAKEYEALCSVVKKLDSNSFDIAFISGKSGSGKSALVSELYKAVAKKGGFFYFWEV